MSGMTRRSVTLYFLRFVMTVHGVMHIESCGKANFLEPLSNDNSDLFCGLFTGCLKNLTYHTDSLHNSVFVAALQEYTM